MRRVREKTDSGICLSTLRGPTPLRCVGHFGRSFGVAWPSLGSSCLLVPNSVRGRFLSTAPEIPTLWHLLSPASSSTQGSFHLRALRSAPYRVTGTERWALERAGQGLASDLRALTKTRRFKPKTPSHLSETLRMIPSPLTARGTRRKYRLLDACAARRCTCHRLGVSTQ